MFTTCKRKAAHIIPLADWLTLWLMFCVCVCLIRGGLISTVFWLIANNWKSKIDNLFIQPQILEIGWMDKGRWLIMSEKIWLIGPTTNIMLESYGPSKTEVSPVHQNRDSALTNTESVLALQPHSDSWLLFLSHHIHHLMGKQSLLYKRLSLMMWYNISMNQLGFKTKTGGCYSFQSSSRQHTV